MSQSITYVNDRKVIKNLEISLIGDFQIDNAALALAACQYFAATNGKELSEQAIRNGLKTAKWSGRMEVLCQNPIFLLDSAHNPDAVMKMTESTRKLFAYAKAIVVVGLMSDKASDKIIEILSRFGDQFILVRPNQRRSENPEKLKAILEKYKKTSEIINSIPKAIQRGKTNRQN